MDEPTPLDADGIVGSLTADMLEKQEGEEGVVESDGCKLVKFTVLLGCEGGVCEGGAWGGV